jgi:hypothetical protein
MGKMGGSAGGGKSKKERVGFTRVVPKFLQGLAEEDGAAMRDKTQAEKVTIEDRDDRDDEAPTVVGLEEHVDSSAFAGMMSRKRPRAEQDGLLGDGGGGGPASVNVSAASISSAQQLGPAPPEPSLLRRLRAERGLLILSVVSCLQHCSHTTSLSPHLFTAQPPPAAAKSSIDDLVNEQIAEAEAEAEEQGRHLFVKKKSSAARVAGGKEDTKKELEKALEEARAKLSGSTAAGVAAGADKKKKKKAPAKNLLSFDDEEA